MKIGKNDSKRNRNEYPPKVLNQYLKATHKESPGLDSFTGELHKPLQNQQYQFFLNSYQKVKEIVFLFFLKSNIV